MKNCGSCKWLDVPLEVLTKKLEVHKRHDYSMYACKVPFTVPPFPVCVKIEIRDSKYRRTAPIYGADCHFHEFRTSMECVPPRGRL